MGAISLTVAGLIVIIALSLSGFINFQSLTGYVTYSGPGEGQSTLMLQTADTENLDDVYADAGVANKNRGIDTDLKVQKTPYQRIYIKFNISEVPSGQIIDNSKLCLYLYNDQGTQTVSASHVYVHDWDEGSEDGTDVSGQDYTTNLTWNNQPCGVDFDNSVNCNLTAEDSINDDGTLDGTWQCWNVTNAVSYEYDANDKNVSIVLYTEDLGNPDIFYSKEYADSSLRPYLNITYHTANTAPTITLTSPQDGENYGYNESLALDFTTSDAEDNIESCWYNIDDETNTTLPSCANTTFNITEGLHTLNIFINDTLSKQSSDSSTFTVAVGAPSITLNSPINTYLSSNTIIFTYTPTDIDLDSCILWGNFSGTFEQNQTNSNPTSATTNTFELTIEEGGYIWNIWCNDTQGNEAFNGNKTFHIDTTPPTILISEPTGTKTSRTNIPLKFSITDANPTTCIYNVMQGASEEISNTTINCSENTTFSVSADADFTLNLYTTDSAENSASSSTTFSISTPTTPTPTPSPGSSSSGGGSGTYVGPKPNLNISEIKSISYPEEEKTIQVSVKNIGTATANKCKIKATGDYADRVSSDDLLNIGGGEIVEFTLTLKTLETNPNPNISIECLELTKQIPIELIIINSELDITIQSMELLSKTELLIKYTIQESPKQSLIFKIIDSEGTTIAEQSEETEPDTIEQEAIITLPETNTGILKVAISTPENENPIIEDTIIYDSSFTGFASKNLLQNNNTYIVLIVAVFLIVAFFMIKRIVKLRKK